MYWCRYERPHTPMIYIICLTFITGVGFNSFFILNINLVEIYVYGYVLANDAVLYRTAGL